MYPGTPGILRHSGVGRYIYSYFMCILFLYTPGLSHAGLPVYPGTPGILRHSGVGRYIYSYFMCILFLYTPGLSQDCRCIPGLLGYSDTVGLDDIYTLTSCVYYSYIPQDCPRIAGVSRDSWDTQTQWGWTIYILLLHMYTIPIYPRIAGVSRDSWDTQTQWGWTIYILLLHVYTIPIYPRIVPGLPVYPGTPGILRHCGVGRHIYSYFMCILFLYTPGLSQDFRCIPGLLGYSDTVGLDDIYTLTSCVYYSYIPQDCPRIAGVSRDSWDTQTQWGWTTYILLLHVYTIPIYPRIVPGLPVYPGTPGILRHSGVGRYIYSYFMCILFLYTPGLSQDCRCMLGLLRYSDAAGLDDVYSYFMYIVHIYTPGMVPGILGYSLGGWRL